MILLEVYDIFIGPSPSIFVSMFASSKIPVPLAIQYMQLCIEICSRCHFAAANTFDGYNRVEKANTTDLLMMMTVVLMMMMVSVCLDLLGAKDSKGELAFCGSQH